MERPKISTTVRTMARMLLMGARNRLTMSHTMNSMRVCSHRM
jgi:hypothetical protein